MRIWIYTIICLSIVGSLQIFAWNHHAIWSSKIDWTGRGPDPQGVSERLVGVAFTHCLRECLVRPYCRAVGYWTLSHVCEIADDDVTYDVTGATTGIQPISGGPCVHVRRGDIVNTSSVGENCASCPNYHVCSDTGSCTVQVCPKLAVANTTLYGNMRTVGARVAIVCPYGPTTTQAVCEHDVCPKLAVANATLYGNMRTVGARVVIVCPYGPTTTQAVCEQNGSWSGVIPCINNCSVPDAVHVGNMTFVVHTVAETQSTAEAFCAGTGDQLLKLDTPAKHDAVRAYFQGNSEYALTDLWVQGQYTSNDQWVFTDGQPMPLDGSLWYEHDGSSACALLRHDKEFQWDDRSCQDSYPFICEIASPECGTL